VKDTIGPGLFEAFDRSVHGLTGSGEGASGQHFDLLCVSNFGACLDDFLAGFLELLGEVSELQHFSLDEGISHLLYCSVDDGLIQLPELEDLLSKGVER
jgi:hypothetical protein